MGCTLRLGAGLLSLLVLHSISLRELLLSYNHILFHVLMVSSFVVTILETELS